MVRDESYDYAIKQLTKKCGDWSRVKGSSLDRLELATTECGKDSSSMENLYFEQKVIFRCLSENSHLGEPHIRLIKKAYPWELMEKVVEKATDFKEQQQREWNVDELMEVTGKAIAVVEAKEGSQIGKIKTDEESAFHINHVQPQEASNHGINRLGSSGQYRRPLVPRFQGNIGTQQLPSRPSFQCAGCKEIDHSLRNCCRLLTFKERSSAVGIAVCRKCYFPEMMAEIMELDLERQTHRSASLSAAQRLAISWIL